jgi:hypothetical protein
MQHKAAADCGRDSETGNQAPSEVEGLRLTLFVRSPRRNSGESSRVTRYPAPAASEQGSETPHLNADVSASVAHVHPKIMEEMALEVKLSDCRQAFCAGKEDVRPSRRHH